MEPSPPNSPSETRTGLLGLLQRLTLDQWDALVDDNPVQTGTRGEQRVVFFFFVLCSLVLLFNNDGATEMWRFMPFEYRQGTEEWRFWRRVTWALFVAVGYTLPTWWFCRRYLGLGLKDLGLTTRGFAKHLPMYVAFYCIVLPFVVWVSQEPHFEKTYPLNRVAHRRLDWLIIWELSYMVQFIGVEFFFRGVLLQGPKKWLGAYTLPLMLIPYCMLHFQKPMLEALGSIIAGAALGMVAMRTGSILAGIGIHTAVAWTMDALALWHRGDLQRLLDSG